MTPISRTGWAPSPVGYSHIKMVKYVDDERYHVSVWADTGSVLNCDGKRYCRIYEDKTIRPSLPTFALFISVVSGALTPLYAGMRLAGIVLTTPYFGIKDSAYRFIKMIFLMIGYAFAHVLTILESIFISPEPVNGRQLIERIEQEMNPDPNKGGANLGLDKSIWLVNPKKNFPKNPLEGGYMWCGCYQSNCVGELDKDNNIVAVRTYGGTHTYNAVKNSSFEAYPWTRAIQWVIAKCTSVPATAASQ